MKRKFLLALLLLCIPVSANAWITLLGGGLLGSALSEDDEGKATITRITSSEFFTHPKLFEYMQGVNILKVRIASIKIDHDYSTSAGANIVAVLQTALSNNKELPNYEQNSSGDPNYIVLKIERYLDPDYLDTCYWWFYFIETKYLEED